MIGSCDLYIQTFGWPNENVFFFSITNLFSLGTIYFYRSLACEQALQGALAPRWKKEGELATTSLEFGYLHRKSRSEMLIGGGDISNAVTTLGTCFSMFVYLPVRFRFALIGGNLTAQSTGSHRGIGGGIRISETQLQVLLPQFARAPRRVCSRANRSR